MLAKPVSELPSGEGWIFEPKWDGFRALVFRDGDEVSFKVAMRSRLSATIRSSFAPLKQQLPERCVLDGEIVIVQPGGLDFEALQLRLHPAASRVEMLSKEIPRPSYALTCCRRAIAICGMHLSSERRAALETLLRRAKPPLHLTPATRDRSVAADWFRRFEGAGLDGVIAKAAAGITSSNRRVMLKVKHARECDCVVAGFRWHKQGQGTSVGSLLLGLYDKAGDLQHVGVCASFTEAKRRELVDFLAPYREDRSTDHPWKDWALSDDEGAGTQRRPGASSRWSQGKDLSWQPLRPELVVEVAYDHMQGTRFRHTAQFRRWRPDKPPRDCTFDQLEVVPPQELAEIFAKGR